MSGHEFDDAERLRNRRAAADADATRRPGRSGGGGPCVVAQVSGDGGGDAAGRYYTMAAFDVLGPEVEGGDGTLVDAHYHFLALNLGSVAPVLNTPVICTFVRYRWVFRYDG